MKSKFRRLILILGDILIMYVSLFVTLLVRYHTVPSSDYWMAHFYPFTFIFLIWISLFFISDLYNLNFAISNRFFFRLALRSFLIGGIFSAVFFYLMPRINIAPKTNLLLFVVIYTLLFILWRGFFNWSIKSYIPKETIGIIGYNQQVGRLLAEFTNKPHLGYEIAFILNTGREKISPNRKIDVIPADEKILKEHIKNKNVSTLILANNPANSESLSSLLFSCLGMNVDFVNLSNFYENILGKVPLDLINKVWFLDNLTEGNKTFYNISSRIMEIIFSIVFLILVFPFGLILAGLIKLDSKGGVFFTQIRVGHNGKNFQIIKFRTMRIEHNDFQPTEENDERITRIGSFLRKTRLDELPQLLNILKGEMSFVGPRPERPELVEELEKLIPFYNERMLAKPGLTGWDQVCNEYHSPSYEDTMEKLQYDLFYIKNRSFYLDLSILLKTISTVFSKLGR